MAVHTIMSNYSTTRVTVVGHALGKHRRSHRWCRFSDFALTGGAIALLDSVYLPLHLPNGTSFQTITYGLPRVSPPVPTPSPALTHLTHTGWQQSLRRLRRCPALARTYHRQERLHPHRSQSGRRLCASLWGSPYR